MDNNYFESLANSIQDSEPKTKNTQENSEATLTVKVDINCKLYCDGDFLDLFEANKVKKISIPTGQHLITIESEQFDEITEDQVIDAMEPGKNYLLLVKDLKEKEDIFKKNKESKIAQATAEKEEKEKEKDKRKKEKEQDELKKAQLVQEVQDNLQKGKEYYEAHIYDLAISCLEKVVAATNDAEALLYIGFCYEGQDGDDESMRDAAKAILWYRKSAEQGFARAQAVLGHRYRDGRGVGQNYVEAVKWYRKSAAQGWVSAQVNLGVCYEKGIGVGQDFAKAVEWYTKAAEQGHAGAQNNLGNCYLNGRGVAQNMGEAFNWYTKAAENGEKVAQYNLGVCYREGLGVETDYAKAIEWYTKAAEQGYTDAQCVLGLYYDDVSEESWGPSGDFAKAEEWYLKAANQGAIDGQYRLGWLYNCYSGLRTGRIIVNNTNNAIKWLTEAANQGEADAMENLGYIYGALCDLDGIGGFDIHSIDDLSVFDACSLSVEWYKKYLETRKDWPTGIYWTTSVLHLARCYQKGDGVEKNLEKARECLESGLKILEDFGVSNDGFINRQQDMQRELGLIYEARWMYTGSKEDRKMAIKWYSKAAKNDDEYSKNRLEKM